MPVGVECVNRLQFLLSPIPVRPSPEIMLFSRKFASLPNEQHTASSLTDDGGRLPLSPPARVHNPVAQDAKFDLLDLSE